MSVYLKIFIVCKIGYFLVLIVEDIYVFVGYMCVYWFLIVFYNLFINLYGGFEIYCYMGL